MHKFDRAITRIVEGDGSRILPLLVEEMRKYSKKYWKLLGLRASFIKWVAVCKGDADYDSVCGICAHMKLNAESELVYGYTCIGCPARDQCDLRQEDKISDKEATAIVHEMYTQEHRRLFGGAK